MKNIEIETPDMASIANVQAGKEQSVMAPVPAQPRAVATVAPAPSTFYSELPCSRVKIAYAVSQNMPDEATEGSLVIRMPDNRWVKLASPNVPVTVLILSARVYYKEWLTSEAFNSGNMPKTYATKEEALAAGETVEWTPNGSAPTVSPAVDVTMLIERPEGLTGVDDAFILALENRVWAPCVMTIDKSNAKKVIESLSRLILRDITVNGVTREQARLSSFFCTLAINAVASTRNPGRKTRVPSFTVLMDKDHRAVAPSQTFANELKSLAELFNNPTAASNMDDMD